MVHVVVGWVLLHAITEATGHFYVALAITIPTVFVLAVLVHIGVEKPSMGLGRRIANRPRFRRQDLAVEPDPVGLSLSP